MLIYGKGRVIASFYCWDVMAVYEHTQENNPRGSTATSFRREGENKLWLATWASVGEVQSVIDDAIAERKKAAPVKIKVSDLKRSAATTV